MVFSLDICAWLSMKRILHVCSSQKLFSHLNFAIFKCTYDQSINKSILIPMVKFQIVFLLVFLMIYCQLSTKTIYLYCILIISIKEIFDNNKNISGLWLSLLNISCCMYINVIIPKKALCSTFVSNMILCYVFQQKSELRSFLYFSNMILMSWPSFQAFNFLSLKCFSFTVWFLYMCLNAGDLFWKKTKISTQISQHYWDKNNCVRNQNS